MTTKPLTTRTIYFAVGHRWHWRILSRWDDSILAHGSSRTRKDAFEDTKQKRKELIENHTRH